MSELVDFLTARLDEDEAVARAAGVGEWESDGREVYRPSPLQVLDVVTSGRCDGTPSGAESPEIAAHIARHDPARVLREVTAKRAILAKYQRAQAAYEQMMNPASTAAVFALAEVVQHMAAVYSDNPDFQEQWR